MLIIKELTPFSIIRKEHSHFFETMVKIVVDIEKRRIALDAEMHADLEKALLEEGSEQNHLWGANLYFDREPWIEFTSLINIRPAQNNRSMEIQSPEAKKGVETTVLFLIQR